MVLSRYRFSKVQCASMSSGEQLWLPIMTGKRRLALVDKLRGLSERQYIVYWLPDIILDPVVYIQWLISQYASAFIDSHLFNLELCKWELDIWLCQWCFTMIIAVGIWFEYIVSTNRPQLYMGMKGAFDIVRTHVNTRVADKLLNQSPYAMTIARLVYCNVSHVVGAVGRRVGFRIHNYGRYLWIEMALNQDDVIKRKHFPRYCPFGRGIHRSPVNSPRKDQRRRASMFFFDHHLNKWLNKQSWGWWFEAPSYSLWRHCRDYISRHIWQLTNPSRLA